jgi:hypothetical protein
MGVAHYLPYGQIQQWGVGGDLIVLSRQSPPIRLTITKRA